MIDAKLIIVFLLSAVPFLIALSWRSNRLRRFYEGMKRSDNFRKFFTLMILMGMILIQFVDFHASTEIARMIQDSSVTSTEAAKMIAIYAPLMTRPYATLLAAAISVSFFSYRWADYVLTFLHDYPKLFLAVAAVSMAIPMVSVRYLIVTEIMYIILIAAYLYPDKNGKQTPRLRLQWPLRNLLGNKRKSTNTSV